MECKRLLDRPGTLIGAQLCTSAVAAAALTRVHHRWSHGPPRPAWSAVELTRGRGPDRRRSRIRPGSSPSSAQSLICLNRAPRFTEAEPRARVPSSGTIVTLTFELREDSA
jgi:hypothetical protein